MGSDRKYSHADLRGAYVLLRVRVVLFAATLHELKQNRPIKKRRELILKNLS
jgi:hypothetical protein